MVWPYSVLWNLVNLDPLIQKPYLPNDYCWEHVHVYKGTLLRYHNVFVWTFVYPDYFIGEQYHPD